MRAYPYVQFSLAVMFVIATSVAGTVVCPQDAMAREPELELVLQTGGTSGGGEWRTPPPDQTGEIPLDPDKAPGVGGKTYSEPRRSAAGDSWAETVNAMIFRMVRFVGTKFSELF